MTSGPFDPGLQLERTELAWQRTAIALGVGSLVAVRLVPLALSDPWWALPGVIGVALSVALMISGRLRCRDIHRRLTKSGSVFFLPPATVLAASAFVAVVIALTGLVIALRAGTSG